MDSYFHRSNSSPSSLLSPYQLSVHAVMMAFVMVVVSALILTPLILFLLGFAGRGWSWVHGALFASMIAPTDALAAAAILKTGEYRLMWWGWSGWVLQLRALCMRALESL